MLRNTSQMRGNSNKTEESSQDRIALEDHSSHIDFHDNKEEEEEIKLINSVKSDINKLSTKMLKSVPCINIFQIDIYLSNIR